jgi:ASC-1-like (ASCH) protein
MLSSCDILPKMSKHLAIMPEVVIEAILSGKKTIETRFSKHKVVPLGVVSVGDIVYLKPPGKEIVGSFRVKKVFNFEGLSKEDIQDIFEEYADRIFTGDDKFDAQFKKDKEDSIYGSLIFISEAERFLTSPVKIQKSDKRGWVVLK